MDILTQAAFALLRSGKNRVASIADYSDPAGHYFEIRLEAEIEKADSEEAEFKSFVENCLDVSGNTNVFEPIPDLYGAYQDYCLNESFDQSKFTQELRKITPGLMVVKTIGGKMCHCLLGLELKNRYRDRLGGKNE
jgi:hypothetical protein